EREIRQKRIAQTLKLSTQVEKAGENVFLGLPIGIVLYNDVNKIEWVNPYMRNLLGDESWRKKPLSILSDSLVTTIENNDEEKTRIVIDHYKFDVEINRGLQALFLFDETEAIQLEQKYEDEKLVLATIYLDNYEEISRNMDDNLKSRFNSLVTSELNQWAEHYYFYIKRTSQDRFFAVMTERTLKSLEESKFEILDEIRNLKVDKTQLN